MAKKSKKTCELVEDLPDDAKVGECFSMISEVKGKNRLLTFKKTRGRGKNKNLQWKITSNKKSR